MRSILEFPKIEGSLRKASTLPQTSSLKEWFKQPQSKYTFNVYSIEDVKDFNIYLDSIENAMTSEMIKELEIVYGES